MNYPGRKDNAEVTGRSFHHGWNPCNRSKTLLFSGRFIQRLRQIAAGEKSVTVRQGTAKALINESGSDFHEGETVCGVRYRSGNVDRIAKAHLTVVCDGMYSTLRRIFVSPSIQSPSYFVGVILKNTKLPFPNYGHVVLGKPSPTLFYPIGTNEVRCLIDIPGGKLPSQANGELKNYVLNVVAPEIPEELRDAFITAVNETELRCVQNKQMSAQPVQQPGALIIGDAYNMRHPLTGGGMTVALSDCKVKTVQ